MRMAVPHNDTAEPGRGTVPGRLENWLARRESLIFIALLVAHLIPIWWFQYFPSLDGPVHLSIADMFIKYDSPETPAFREFFEINTNPDPNLFIFAVLYVLMQIFPPLLAEKILLSGYVVLLPLALRYALRAAAPEASVLSFLAFPMIYHAPLHLGFYNFSFGMAFFLFSFGFWVRHSEKAGPGVFLGHLFLSLLAYFTHLFALAISCAAIAFTTFGTMALDLLRQRRDRAFDPGFLWRALKTRAIIPAAAYLPALVLSAAYLLERKRELTQSGLESIGWPVGTRIEDLMVAASLVSHDASERLVAAAFVFILLAVAGLVVVRKIPGASRINGLFFCFLGFLCLYFLTPYQFHVRWMPTRIMPFVFFALILWFGSQLLTAAPRRAALVRPLVVVAIAAVSLAGLSVRSAKYAEINGYIREYLSGVEHIERNATVVSLRLNRLGEDELISERIDLFLQAAGYIALQRSVINLNNSQAASGIFPIVFRESLDPYRHLATDWGYIGVPPRVDLFRYAARTGKDIDYVVLWGGGEHLRESAAGRRLMAQLEEAYEHIFTSPRRGLMRLYRLKKRAGAGRDETTR